MNVVFADTRWSNTTVTRRYLDDAKEWKDAATCNSLADLALFAEALRMSQDFIRRDVSELPNGMIRGTTMKRSEAHGREEI